MKPKTIIKLVLASLVVGFVMVSLGVTPGNVWSSFVDAAVWIGENIADFFEWALIYIIVGGAVVVPIYVVRQLVNKARKATGRSQPGSDSKAE